MTKILLSYLQQHQWHSTSSSSSSQDHQPGLWTSNFTIDCSKASSGPLDTFLDPTGWTKGVAFVNGFNLGRYWPAMGPQVTLYVPRTVLRCGPSNQLIILELEGVGGCDASCPISFVSQPTINGTVPISSSDMVMADDFPFGRWDTTW